MNSSSLKPAEKKDFDVAALVEMIKEAKTGIEIAAVGGLIFSIARDRELITFKISEKEDKHYDSLVK